DLRVDTRAAIRAGGERGPAVVPGDVASSLLLAAITHADPDLKMPPKTPRLPDAVIADVKRWIEMGAPDPRDGEAAARDVSDAELAAEHWAYQPLVDPPLPEITVADAGVDGVDAGNGAVWARRD